METADDPVLETRGLGVDISGHTILSGVDLSIPSGSFLGILGPNGSGKTSLLRTLTGMLDPSCGEVRLHGRPLSGYTRREVARELGVVPQFFSLDFKFTVEEVVGLGRYPYGTAFGRPYDADTSINDALEVLSLTHLATRPITELSGGERQRVVIAQTLAQDTPVLLLDEPLNNLDLNHQLEVMQLLQELHARGRTIVVVLHDINVAGQYCHRLAVMAGGHLVADGTPAETLTPDRLFEVFATRVTVHSQGGRLYVTPVAPSSDETPGASTFPLHVSTGGGAGADLLNQLVQRGFTPSVGVVSVFDSDYQTARQYQLPVASSPPFEPLTEESIEHHRRMVENAACLVLAPQVYGHGNLAVLEVALEAARAATSVILVDDPPIAERDLAGGRAAHLEDELTRAGAVRLPDIPAAVTFVRKLAANDTLEEQDPCG